MDSKLSFNCIFVSFNETLTIKYPYSGRLLISTGHQPYISQVPLDLVTSHTPVFIPKEDILSHTF